MIAGVKASPILLAAAFDPGPCDTADSTVEGHDLEGRFLGAITSARWHGRTIREAGVRASRSLASESPRTLGPIREGSMTVRRDDKSPLRKRGEKVEPAALRATSPRCHRLSSLSRNPSTTCLEPN